MATESPKTTKMKQRLIVTAIDIGTTYSGWAYSTLNEPEKVHANQTWFASEGSLASLKTSSCVLFTPEKEFKHFGYEAETEFVRLAGENEHQGWYYFHRFKMALLNDQAGIPNNQLVVALEPEAASVWCQGIKTEIQRCDGKDEFGISAVGTRYMIVDLGGGTADITVHEKRPNNTLLEIHEQIGGPWGGIEVDKNFIELFEIIFGESEWQEYKRNEVEDLLYIYRDLEVKKRNVQLMSLKQMILKVPPSFKEHYERNGHRSITEIQHLFDGNIIWKKDKLSIDASLIRQCFQGPVHKIIYNVETILSKRKLGAK